MTSSDRGAGPLPASVAAALRRLQVAGYEAVSVRGAGSVDHVIVCDGPGVRVRLTADRGQWWVEGGGPEGDDWFDADLWRIALGEPGEDGAGPEEQVVYLIETASRHAAAEPPVPLAHRLRALRSTRARERLGLPPA